MRLCDTTKFVFLVSCHRRLMYLTNAARLSVTWRLDPNKRVGTYHAESVGVSLSLQMSPRFRDCAPAPPNTWPFSCRLPCVYPCSRARFVFIGNSFAENEEERDRANIHVHRQASTFRCFPKGLADAGLPGGEGQETTLMQYYRCWTGRCREGGVYRMATVVGAAS